MITSSSIQYISQVLNDPENVSVADKESIDALVQAFPYFVPARYMGAATDHKEQPFQAPMMSRMQLYAGNWLLYNQFLNTAVNGQPAAPVAQITPEETPVDTQITEASVGETQVTDETRSDAIMSEPPVAVNAVTEDTPVAEAPTVHDSEAFVEAQPLELVTEPTPAEEAIAEPLVTITEEPVFEAAIATADVPVIETIAEAEVVTEQEPEVTLNNESFIVAEPSPATTPEPAKKEPLYKELNKHESPAADDNDESFILPVYTEDYFLHQGMQVSNVIPTDIPKRDATTDEDKQLMVVMSFAEWLVYFKNRKAKEAEEAQDQKAVKTMWQKEKLAAAMEEENEEIPEKVFEMAVNSITKEDDLASESLAEIHAKQGRYDKAIEMYRKLSLRNPQKKAYFARRIERILKEKES